MKNAFKFVNFSFWTVGLVVDEICKSLTVTVTDVFAVSDIMQFVGPAEHLYHAIHLHFSGTNILVLFVPALELEFGQFLQNPSAGTAIAALDNQIHYFPGLFL